MGGGVKLGNNVDICPHCFVGNNNHEIGDSTFINYNVWFNTAGGIKIGCRCNIAYQVTFATSTHLIGSKERRAGTATAKSIEIGNGTWIGARSVILPGVKIGDGVIIGAGTVVVEDCEDNSLYAGNPAHLVKRLK